MALAERFAAEGFKGCCDKTRPSRIAALGPEALPSAVLIRRERNGMTGQNCEIYCGIMRF